MQKEVDATNKIVDILTYYCSFNGLRASITSKDFFVFKSYTNELQPTITFNFLAVADH